VVNLCLQLASYLRHTQLASYLRHTHMVGPQQLKKLQGYKVQDVAELTMKLALIAGALTFSERRDGTNMQSTVRLFVLRPAVHVACVSSVCLMLC
jgi:hypothetical protein